jgi:hypothetical protein
MKRLKIILLFIALTSAGYAGEMIGHANDQSFPVKKDTNRFELKIYPNPTETGRITLEMAGNDLAEIRLVNIAGKEIMVRKPESGTSKYQLVLEGVPNGIYFVRVHTTEMKVVVKKLIVSGR